MLKNNQRIKVAIDSPAAAGAGTIAKQYQNIIIYFMLIPEKHIG